MGSKRTSVLDWLERRLNLTEIFSFLTSFGLFYTSVDSSKPLRQAVGEALDKPLPSYSRWPRVLSLIVVLLLGLEGLTGGLLALYYLPTPETAHASLGTILRDVDFGWLIRQLHFWGAQVLLAVLILRVVRFFVQRVYRTPRELLWVFGWSLFLVALHSDLTGRLLPWSAESYWSAVRALEIARAVPIYGSVVVFLIGGADWAISDLTLIRFYILHVAILPALAVPLVYLHFSNVRQTGLAETADETKLPGRVAFRLNFLNMIILLTVAFAILLSLAVLAPIPFGAAADPFATVPGVGPPWYLLAPFAVLELTAGFLPRWIAGSILFLSTLVVVGLPFWYRPAEDKGQRVAILLGSLTVLLWLLLTWYGARVA